MPKSDAGATVYWIDRSGQFRVSRIDRAQLKRGHDYESEARILFEFPDNMAVVLDSQRGLPWASEEIARIRAIADQA